jgi:hypothetical protein
MIPTPDTLRATRRRLTKRVGRMEKADAVMAVMRDAGLALHLQHTKQGPCWTLSNGQVVADHVARLVATSASVVSVDGALFAGCLSQTYRWWRET